MTDALSLLLDASHLLARTSCAARRPPRRGGFGVRETVHLRGRLRAGQLLPLGGVGVPEPAGDGDGGQRWPGGPSVGCDGREPRARAGRAGSGCGYRCWTGWSGSGSRNSVLPAAADDNLERDLRAFVTLVAELMVVNDAYSDVFARLAGAEPSAWPPKCSGNCSRR